MPHRWNSWGYRILIGYIVSMEKLPVSSPNTSTSFSLQIVCKLPWRPYDYILAPVPLHRRKPTYPPPLKPS